MTPNLETIISETSSFFSEVNLALDNIPKEDYQKKKDAVKEIMKNNPPPNLGELAMGHIELAKFLQHFNWYNPLNSLSNGKNNIGNLGRLIPGLLGWKKAESPGKIREKVFKEIHGDFKTYLENCYNGKIEDFLIDIRKQKGQGFDTFFNNLRGSFKENIDNQLDKESILKHFNWYNPLNISNGGKNGSASLGFLIPGLFGWETARSSGEIQERVFKEAHGDFKNYLENCYGGKIEGFLEEIRKLKGNSLNTFSNSLIGAFKDNINNQPNKESVLKYFNWYNPLKISQKGRNSPLSFGKLVPGLLGWKKSVCCGAIQQEILKNNHGDFKTYLENCYNGKIEDFLVDLRGLNGKSSGTFSNSLRNSFKDTIDFQLDKESVLKHFNWYNPLNISIHGKNGLSKLGRFIPGLIGWKKSKCAGETQEKVFKEIHGDFKTYLENCYNGKIEDFLIDIRKQKGQGLDTFFNSLRNSFKDTIDFQLDKESVLKHFNWYNPLNISDDSKDGSKYLGCLILGLLGWETSRSSGPIQQKIFEKIHGNFKGYLENCYGSNIEDFLGEMGELKGLSLSIFYKNLRKSFKETIENQLDKELVLKNFNWYNPLNISDSGKNGSASLGALMSGLLGWKISHSSGEIQEKVFKEVHRDFKGYLDNCYSGKIEDFLIDIRKRKSHGFDTSFNRLRNSFKDTIDFQLDKESVLKHFNWYNPLNISSEGKMGTYILGNLIPGLLNWEISRSPGPIQEKIFEEIFENDINNYFEKLSINPSSKEFIDLVAKKYPFTGKSVFLDKLKNYYKKENPSILKVIKEKSKMTQGVAFENFLYSKNSNGKTIMESYFNNSVQRATLVNGGNKKYFLDGVVGNDYVSLNSEKRLLLSQAKEIVEIKLSKNAVLEEKIKTNNKIKEASIKKYLQHCDVMHLMFCKKKGLGWKSDYAGSKQMISKNLGIPSESLYRENNQFSFDYEGKRKKIVIHALDDFKDRIFNGDQKEYNAFRRKCRDYISGGMR